MLLQKFFRILALVLLLAGCTAASEFDASELQGRWTSLDDTKSVIEFTGQEKIDIYDGSELSRGNFQLSNDGTLKVTEGGEIFEYRIDQLGAQNLVLMFLPRGNLLRYAR